MNFENGGTTIQIGILHVLLNILSISLLSKVHETSGYLRCKNTSHVISRFQENKLNAGGWLELLASIVLQSY